MNQELLKNKNIRVTDFRLSVLDVFHNHENAISIELLEKSLGSHDRITLYRTLKTFINKGLIHEILLPGDVKKMALCDNNCSTGNHQHEHVHFHCNSCDEVYCLPLPQHVNIEPKGFKVDYYEVVAKGTCESCL